MRTALRTLGAFWTLFACCAAHAVEVQTLNVWRDGPAYLVDLQVSLDVPAQQAFAVMRDYGQLAQINSAVQKAELVEGGADGTQRVAAEVRVCVAFFCRTLRQVQDMSATQLPDGGGRIHADVIASLSNLDAGTADWHVWDCRRETGSRSARSCLSFRASLDPGFWVPPLIGPYVIRKKLQEEALETSHGIEAAAIRYAAREDEAAAP